MINGYSPGDDITIIDTHYSKIDNTKDVITVIYRDNVTGVKHHQDFVNPMYEFYVTNDDVSPEFHQLFIEKHKVHPVQCKYIEREKKIAEVTGNLDFYFNNIRSRNFSANKQLYASNDIFMADVDINDFYRFKFNNIYQNNPFKLTKAYFDIEVRVKGMPEEDDLKDHYGDYPIDVLTLINDKNGVITTLILRDSENPLVEEFEQYVKSGEFDKELREFVQKSVGGYKQAIRYGISNYKYEQVFYDDELQLLQDLFMYINVSQPDVILSWNMAFDIPYVIERLKKLGVDPADIMCHPDFKNRNCYYYIDTQHEMDFELKGDYACISSYTLYMDQLPQFASRRKGQAKLPNYKLDTIGKIMCKIGKYDFFDPKLPFGERQYVNFKEYVKYNIMDTIVQKVIEHKVDDIGFVFNKALMNNTRINKAHRQTVYLTNRGIQEFYDDGLIMGTNINKFKDKPTIKFLGAIVGDPTHMVRETLLHFMGVPTNMIDNGNDFDYRALYPSEIDQHNIALNTIIGKAEAYCKLYENENPFNNERYDRVGDMFECLQSESIIEFCHRYLEIADYKELINDIKYFFTHKRIKSNPMCIDKRTGMVVPVSMYQGDNLLLNPVSFNTKEINPVIFINPYTNMDDVMREVKYEQYIPFRN